jgi:outer membrane protein assembly factor BamC
LLLVSGLAGCSAVGSLFSDDKVDYRSAAASSRGLEVPPDLTQLASSARFQQSGSSVSASSYGAATNAAPLKPVVAPRALGTASLERLGNERWLASSLPPDQLWPQLQTFWKEAGFNLVLDQPVVGIMETDWTENRAKLPQDGVRRFLGKFFDSFYSTGERDKYRLRVERTAAGGSEVYLTHKGMEEVYSSAAKDNTTWQARPNDPQLEAELLQRLLIKLAPADVQASLDPAAAAASAAAANKAAAFAAAGSKGKTASAAAAPNGPARARLVDSTTQATVQLDDKLDNAWRRVGQALERVDAAIEDKDRIQGVYFVRLIDPTRKDLPGFLAKYLVFNSTDPNAPQQGRMRVQIKADAQRSTITVFNRDGQPDNSEQAQKLARQLVEQLK